MKAREFRGIHQGVEYLDLLLFLLLAVSVSRDGSYIVTGSLDQSVKFHCSSKFNVLYSLQMDEAVTAVTTYETSDGCEALVIGLRYEAA